MDISKKEEKFLKEFGQKLRDLRLKKGWTLEETEEHGWPNWRHLQKIEQGKNITLVTMIRICKLYKISLRDLMA